MVDHWQPLPTHWYWAACPSNWKEGFNPAFAEIGSGVGTEAVNPPEIKNSKTNQILKTSPQQNLERKETPIADINESEKQELTLPITIPELPEQAVAVEAAPSPTTSEQELSLITAPQEMWALAPDIAGLSPVIDYEGKSLMLNEPFSVKRAGQRFLSVELQGLTSSESWLTGAGLNLLADVKLGNNGWALQTGLGLEWQKRPIEVYAYDGQLYSYSYLTRNADELGLEVDSTLIDAESFPTTNYSEDVAEIALTAQTFYLNVPVKLSKQIGSRWSVFGGANVGYLLKAIERSGNPQNEFNIVNGPGSFDAQNAVYFDNNVALRSSSSAFEPAFFNRWQIMALGGVQYKVTPRMDIGLAYRHHLNGLIKDIEINKGEGQGYLSLMYRL